MFIQTEATPNPATLKFIPGRNVNEGAVCDFRSPEQAGASPLAMRLFAIDGICGVFLGRDFIAVTKQNREWRHLKPEILGAVMEHFLSGAPVLDTAEAVTEDTEFFAEDDRAVVDAIKELLDSRVRPAVTQDGGDITFHGFRDGVVFLHMRGACAGCPSATVTLKHGVENLMRHFIPEVREVRPITTP